MVEAAMQETKDPLRTGGKPRSAIPAKPNPNADRQAARRAEARERLAMAALTVTCLVSLVAAWVGKSTGILPDDGVTILAALAYLGGGGFATVRALDQLRRGSLSVDLLMVSAALGAATVGAWAEGGVLLFL